MNYAIIKTRWSNVLFCVCDRNCTYFRVCHFQAQSPGPSWLL